MMTRDGDETHACQEEKSVEAEYSYEEESGDDSVRGEDSDSPPHTSGSSRQRVSLSAASLAALAAAYVNARNSVTLRALYSKAEINEVDEKDASDDESSEEGWSDDEVAPPPPPDPSSSSPSFSANDGSEMAPLFVKRSATSTSELIKRQSYATATPRHKALRLLANTSERLGTPNEEEEEEEEEEVQMREKTIDNKIDILALDAEGRKKKKKRKSSMISAQKTNESGANIDVLPLVVESIAVIVICLVMFNSWKRSDVGVEETKAGGEGFDWYYGLLGYGRQKEL